MEYMLHICLSFLVLPVVHGAIRPNMDHRWKEPLPVSTDVLEGDNVTLAYRYTAPYDVRGEVNVELSHHKPSNNYENVLIGANINPLNRWKPDVTFEHTHGRVIIDVDDRGFTFQLVNFRLNEWGRYWTDVSFSSGKTLSHWIDMDTYQRPSFTQTPAEQIVRDENETVTFEWCQTKSDVMPEVEAVRITYNNYTLVHQIKLPDTGQWMITYPDEVQKFKNRISYAASSTLKHISLSVSDLRINDSGLYTLEIIYRNQIVKLVDGTTLEVTRGYGWDAAPNQTTYIVAGHETNLEFQPNVATDEPSLKYELFKLTNQSVEPFLSYKMVHNATTYESRRMNWKVNFNKARNCLKVTIREPTSLDGGRYLLKLTKVPKSTIIAHHFNLVILNETELAPIIKPTPDYSENNTTFCISIDVKNYAPKPNIVVYVGYVTSMPNGSLSLDSSHPELGMTVYARVNKTAQLELCVARSAQHNVVLVVLLYADMPGVRAESAIKIPQLHLVELRSTTSTFDKGEDLIQVHHMSTSNILLICVILVVILAVIACVMYYIWAHNKPRTNVVAGSSGRTLLPRSP